MDCFEAIDDYCDVSQPTSFEIPETTPPSDKDQFFLTFEVETTFPLEEEEKELEEMQLVEVESNRTFTFWAPCPRFKQKNLTKERVSGMLSSAGVVLHKQDFMIEKILRRGDEIANAASNRAKRILPMVVSISIVACRCYPRNSEG